jgi:hypothetical protein
MIQHEPPIPLPFIISDEANPVEKHVALVECLIKKHLVILEWQPENLRQAINKVLLQVREEGYSAGIDKTNKLYQHLNNVS